MGSRIVMCAFVIAIVQGFCMQGDLCPYDHGIDPVVVDDVNLSTVLPFTSQGNSCHNEAGKMEDTALAWLCGIHFLK
jgi:hypothetical protein